MKVTYGKFFVLFSKLITNSNGNPVGMINTKENPAVYNIYFNNNKLKKVQAIWTLVYNFNVIKNTKGKILGKMNIVWDKGNTHISFEEKNNSFRKIYNKMIGIQSNNNNHNYPRNPNMNQQPTRNNRKNYNVGEFVNINYEGKIITAEIIVKKPNGTYIVSLGGGGSKGNNKGVRIRANDIIGKQEP